MECSVSTFYLSTFCCSFGEVEWLAEGHTASKRHSEVPTEARHTSPHAFHHQGVNTLQVKASKLTLCQISRPPTQPVNCRPRLNLFGLYGLLSKEMVREKRRGTAPNDDRSTIEKAFLRCLSLTSSSCCPRFHICCSVQDVKRIALAQVKPNDFLNPHLEEKGCQASKDIPC